MTRVATSSSTRYVPRSRGIQSSLDPPSAGRMPGSPTRPVRGQATDLRGGKSAPHITLTTWSSGSPVWASLDRLPDLTLKQVERQLVGEHSPEPPSRCLLKAVCELTALQDAVCLVT